MASKPAMTKAASKSRPSAAAQRAEVASLQRQVDEKLTRLHREARELREQSEKMLAEIKSLGW